MTIVEKAAYLKGLTDGLGLTPDSKEGKLWCALNDLLADMAREIEDLQNADADFADTLDEIGNELTYLEEITCDLDTPEDFENLCEEDDDSEDGEEPEDHLCFGNCDSCSNCADCEYDTCPSCSSEPEEK